MITHQLSATTPDDPSYEIRPSHWNAEHAQAFTILGNTAGASTISGTNIVLSAGPNATISVNGSTLVFSGGAGAAGNTGYLSDDAGVTASLGTVRFSNSGGIGWGINGQTLTASHNGLTSQSNQAFSAPGGSSAFQTLVFANSQGVSWSNSNGSVVATVATNYAASDHSHGNPTLALTNLSGTTASNSAGLTLSLSAAAPGGGNFSAGISGGNTSGDTGTVSNQIVFAGGNNITVSGSTNAGGMSVTISGANAGGAQTGISGVGVSDTTYSSGTVIWSAQANVTLGSSVNGASQYVRVSVGSQSNQSVGVYHVGNTTGQSSSSTVDARSISVDGAGIVSAGWSNGSIRISATQSNQAFSAGAASSTFQTLSFQDSNGLSFSNNAGAIRVSYTRNVASNAIQSVGSATNSGTNTSRFAADDHVHAGVFSVGVSNVGNTAGDTRVDVGRFVFAGGANITLSQATAANGLNTISVVGGGGGGGSQSVGMSTQTAGGATAGTTGYASGSAILYHLVPGSNITMSQSVNGASGTMSIYAPSPGAAAENNWFNLLGANTAGNTTASGSTIGLSGINLTLSGTNNSAINISAPATSSLVGTHGISISTAGSTISVQPVGVSTWNNLPALLTTVGAPINASASIIYLPMDNRVSGSRLDLVASVNVGSAANTSSAAVLWSVTAVLLTKNGNTLNSVSSATTASEMRWQSNSTASVTGAFFFSVPLNIDAAAGNYWCAVQLSTRATGHTGANTTSLGNTFSMMGVGSAQFGAFSVREPGAGSNSSLGWYSAHGMYSSTGNLSAISVSAVSQVGTLANRAAVGVRIVA